jgi:hypothetical protein
MQKLKRETNFLDLGSSDLPTMHNPEETFPRLRLHSKRAGECVSRAALESNSHDLGFPL